MLVYDYITKEAYIFVSSNLPIDGWFHKCFICAKITSKTFFYRQDKEVFIYYYKCPPCYKHTFNLERQTNINKALEEQYNKYKHKFIF